MNQSAFCEVIERGIRIVYSNLVRRGLDICRVLFSTGLKDDYQSAIVPGGRTRLIPRDLPVEEEDEF